jgi:hypothetical protein
MRPILFFPWFLLIILCCCQQRKATSPNTKQDTVRSIIIDNALQDTIERHIQFISGMHFSHFKTPIEAHFFSNDKLVDSIIQPDFGMISWYSNHGDTVDLVAHVGEFETEALLVRFIGDKPTVFFFRAPHERQNYFKINKTDSFANQIEVPPIQYKLLLSKIPDTINKPVVFGHIAMESSNYYDKRDTLQRTHRIQMKFDFRSQFRKFDY